MNVIDTLVQNPPASETDEISLHDAWLRLRAGWKIIAAFLLVASVGSVSTAFLMTPIFDSTALLAVTTQDDSAIKGTSGLSKIASQFGMASDMLDFGGSSDQKAEAIATLASRVLLETYIREQNLLPILFAEKWDAQKGEWKEKDPAKQPTVWDGYKLFNKKIRTVTEDKKTGLVQFAISWKDRNLAAKWANDIVARTNAYLRNKALDTSSRHINYLNDELKRTNVLELQEAIYRLLEIEIKKTMLARGNEEYSFKTIDPAVVPQERSRPRRWLIITFGTVTGLFLGVVVALLRKTPVPGGMRGATAP